MGIFHRIDTHRDMPLKRPKSPKGKKIKGIPDYKGPAVYFHKGETNPYRYADGTAVKDPLILRKLVSHPSYLD